MPAAEAVAFHKRGSPLGVGSILRVARYRFGFRIETTLRLPEFAGSLLRGQFGAALRRTVCMTGLRQCPECPLYRSCPYPAIFETPPPESHPLQKFNQVPNPYVIEPPPFGTREVAATELLFFGIVLVGNAVQQLPLITYALQRAFLHGIGKSRVRGELESVEWEGQEESVPLWDAVSGNILPHDARLEIPPLGSPERLRLRIFTPLRLQNQGKPLSADDLRPRTLVTALMRRASLLFEMHADMPGIVGDATALARHAEGLVDSRQLRWLEWTRFSSRQQQEMKLGGVVGEWTLRGALGPVLIWLWLGQWLHVGKNSTMGMGRYVLELD